MNVTYVCNNHCTFCAVGTRTQIDGHPTRQREHLDLYRAEGVKMVDFDGGEPTMNPELIPLVRYARSIGYERVNVTTNGRMCFYPDFARRLVRSGLTTLLFSVHGPDARTHAQQVGVAEAFEQTVGGIQNCVRLAPRGVELGMNITITKGNFDKLCRRSPSSRSPSACRGSTSSFSPRSAGRPARSPPTRRPPRTSRCASSIASGTA